MKSFKKYWWSEKDQKFRL